MKDKINQQAIENFVYTMDMNLTMKDNLDNAYVDYIAYNWSVETLFELTQEIIRAYNQAEIKARV